MKPENNSTISENDREILQAVHSIKYGTVLVIIQNSEIVQIEFTNKRRFDKSRDQSISKD